MFCIVQGVNKIKNCLNALLATADFSGKRFWKSLLIPGSMIINVVSSNQGLAKMRFVGHLRQGEPGRNDICESC